MSFGMLGGAYPDGGLSGLSTSGRFCVGTVGLQSFFQLSGQFTSVTAPEVSLVMWIRAKDLSQGQKQITAIEISGNDTVNIEIQSWTGLGGVQHIVRGKLVGTSGAFMLNAQMDYSDHGINFEVWFPVLMSYSKAQSKSSMFIRNIECPSYTTQVFTENIRTNASNSYAGKGASTNEGQVDISCIWYAHEFIDFTVQANRDKFFDGSFLAAPLGENGNLPTGNQPLIYAENGDLMNHTGSGPQWTCENIIPVASSAPSPSG